jgi:hypothetical protein
MLRTFGCSSFKCRFHCLQVRLLLFLRHHPAGLDAVVEGHRDPPPPVLPRSKKRNIEMIFVKLRISSQNADNGSSHFRARPLYRPAASPLPPVLRPPSSVLWVAHLSRLVIAQKLSQRPRIRTLSRGGIFKTGNLVHDRRSSFGGGKEGHESWPRRRRGGGASDCRPLAARGCSTTPPAAATLLVADRLEEDLEEPLGVLKRNLPIHVIIQVSENHARIFK